MRELSLNDLEVEIVTEIRKWRDELMEDGGSPEIGDLDAGDAAKLAAEIVSRVIRTGVRVVGPLEARRKLSDGWET